MWGRSGEVLVDAGRPQPGYEPLRHSGEQHGDTPSLQRPDRVGDIPPGRVESRDVRHPQGRHPDVADLSQPQEGRVGPAEEQRTLEAEAMTRSCSRAPSSTPWSTASSPLALGAPSRLFLRSTVVCPSGARRPPAVDDAEDDGGREVEHDGGEEVRPTTKPIAA